MTSLLSKTLLTTTAAVAFSVALGSGPALAQSTQAAPAPSDAEIAIDLLELLVEEGVVPADRAQALLDRARQTAALRVQAAAPPTPTTIDVAYVPELVRNQIRDEIRTEVMTQARTEGWVAPNTMPEWLNRISLTGDFRLRFQGDYFDEGNYPFFPDANAINEAGGVTTAEGFPLLNSTVNRNRYRYRARLGINAQLSDQVFMGIVLASGNDDGAVSTNETLGDYFKKDPIWIDKAYLRYQPMTGVTLTGGRMPNPFYSTDMVWDTDINPEGVALTLSHDFGPLEVFSTSAYLPLQERELDDEDRYLAATQFGATIDLGETISVKAAAAYYAFANVQSRRNPPQGSRIYDYTAPAVLARGNSIFNMRTDGTTTLAGLASDFDVLNINGQVDYTGFDGLRVRVIGDFAKNLAYDRAGIELLQAEASVPSGDIAWQARVDFGTLSTGRRGDWRVSAAYKYIETDAVLDIFTDSDFGLGGTDLEGFVLEGEYGVADSARLNLKWLSTDAISRPPFSTDVLQVTLETEF